jgi:hypothetical protein
MLEQLSGHSVNFIKVVGSLVTGFTALCYATGFLAWNSRMIYLGMPEAEIVDVNYLITGAQFFVFLPLRLIVGLLHFRCWGWILWTLLFIIACIALLNVRASKAKWSTWAFLSMGFFFVMLLFIPLTYDPFTFDEGAFFRYLLDPQKPGILFSPGITPREVLEENYSMLILLTVLALVGTGLLLSWQKTIAEALPSANVEEQSPSEAGEKKNVAERVTPLGFLTGVRSLFTFAGDLTSWRAVSNVIPLLVGMLALIYLVMLPMNFIYPVLSKRYPVVHVRLNQEGGYSEIQLDTELFLLEQDEHHVLLYSRKDLRIFPIDRASIKEWNITDHRTIWGNRSAGSCGYQ